MSSIRQVAASGAVLLALATYAAPAGAETAQQTVLQVAGGACSANNPANQGSLRWLPGGLRNVGTVNVSVVCNQWGMPSDVAPNWTWIYMRNDKTAGVNVTCTLSMGTPQGGQVVSTESVYVAAGATAQIYWDGESFGANAAQHTPNMQCSLPPGVTMREIGIFFTQYVGA